MYHLSSSLADRVRFDEAASAWAYECLRAAAVPIWKIDPKRLARHDIKLGGLPKSDDPAEAKARYIDAFCRAHAEMLCDEIEDTISEIELLGDVDIDKHIRQIQLLQMPNEESLAVLGDAAGHYGDNGGDPDGDLWLAPAKHFSPDELAAALAAGGKVIDGYAFPYPRGVVINRHLKRIIAPGEVAIGGWCAYHCADIGYALRREVAAAVCAASIAQARKSKRKVKNEQLAAKQ
jgi:hypothetical protein